MDTIHLRDLTFKCIVGATAAERRRKQSLRVQLALRCELRRAGRSDRLADTVDYRRLADDVVRRLGASRFVLIERVAEEIAALCLRDARVAGVTVVVDKPGALRRARSAAVEIRRARRGRARR